MKHPLHFAVGEEMHRRLGGRFEIIRDPACGGNHHLPLFVGPHKARDTRMCCVDSLVLESGKIRAIVIPRAKPQTLAAQPRLQGGVHLGKIGLDSFQ